MKLTKKEILSHLDQYPDDYELNLSHYFLVEVTPGTRGKNKGKPRFVDAQVNLPISGTAADAENKEIRFVLNAANEDVLKRIEQGNVHPIAQAEPEEKSAEETKAAFAG
jgi:TolA-binding protein